MKHKTLLYCLLGLLPVVTAVRVLHLIFTVNPEDGFAYVRFERLNAAINIALVAVCAVFVLLGLLLKRTGKVHLPKSSLSAGIGSFIMSLCLFCSVVIDITAYSGSGANAPTVWETVVLALNFMMGLIFFCIGVYSIAGRKIPAFFPVFTVLWSVALLVLFYKDFNGIILNTENTLNLMAMCASMIFWLNYAHLCVDYNPGSSIKSAYIFGSVAVIFCTLCTVPRAVLRITGHTDVLNSTSVINPVNIGMTIFIVIFLFEIAKAVKKAIPAGIRRPGGMSDEKAAPADVFTDESTSGGNSGLPDAIEELLKDIDPNFYDEGKQE